MAIEAPNIQWPSGVPYVAGDRGTTAETVKDVTPFVPETLVGSENFETDPISGAGTWTLTTTTPHSGTRALRSAVIGNLGTTDYVFPVPVGATQIRFWWRVSSEATFDLFRVLVNAVVVFTQSGLTDTWASATLNVAGASTVTFRYSKDGSSASGLDRAMIDDIDWISVPAIAAVQNYEPLHLDPTNQLKVTDGALAVVLANKATEATLAAFKTENDSNLDLVNAKLTALIALGTGPTWQQTTFTATGTPQNIKLGPGILHAVWVGRASDMAIYNSIGTATNLYMSSDGVDVPASTFLSPIDVSFTLGLTVTFRLNRVITVFYS